MVPWTKKLSQTVSLCVAAGLMLTPGTADALEGGGTVYPHGAENWLVGALPPPGAYLLNYSEVYTANRFNGSDGDKLYPTFHLQAFVYAARGVYVTPFKVFGGTPFVAGLLPVVDEWVRVPGAKGSTSGIFELDLTQGIGWHLTPSHHLIVGVDEFLPFGNYSPTDVASASLNRTTIEPVVAYTYVNPKGPEFDIKAMYDFNLTNPTTHYKSGQDFHFDYALGWNITPKLTVGAGGYFEHQMTGDRIFDTRVGEDGFKMRGFAIGPNVQYKIGHMLARLKWQIEPIACNRPQGNAVWASLVVPL